MKKNVSNFIFLIEQKIKILLQVSILDPFRPGAVPSRPRPPSPVSPNKSHPVLVSNFFSRFEVGALCSLYVIKLFMMFITSQWDGNYKTACCSVELLLYVSVINHKVV